MTSTQPNSTSTTDNRESLILGIYDRLYDHGHCTVDVVLAPAKDDGAPDWERANPATVEALPHDLFPDDAADRACVIVSNVDGCDPDATFLVRFVDDRPDLIQIHGPEIDRPIAEQIIARDVGAEPPPPPSKSRLQESLDRLSEKFERETEQRHQAANDNEPISKFKRGDRVLHDKLGTGTVLLSVGGRSTVKFDSGEQSYFIDAFLKPTTAPAPTPIHATPFVLRDPASLPERDWLYGKHYIRQYATASVGPGGGGKTAHSISETLAMVTGRPLLDPDAGLATPLRVWWINCEDPQPEIDRRFHAAAKHFNVTAEQIGDRLFTDSGRDQDFVIARQVGRDLKIVDPFIDQMVAEIDRRRIDVVIVDPFVSTHEAQENDNTAMQRVAAAWTVVADRANCGVELVHHVAKGQGEITADSARGGGAFKDKVRSMRVFNVMTAAEAEKAGIDDPRSYFRLDFGKVNMVASGRSQWRRFVSVPLGNGKGLVKTGDEIGVVEPWRWPSADILAERAAERRRAVVADVPDDLLAGLKVRLGASDHKYDPKGKPWAGDLVMELTGVTDRKEARAMLDAWIESGDLDVVELYDASARKPRNFVKPASAPT